MVRILGPPTCRKESVSIYPLGHQLLMRGPQGCVIPSMKVELFGRDPVVREAAILHEDDGSLGPGRADLFHPPEPP